MADLAEDGIDRGYNPKATSAESLVLPDGDKAGIKAMLGVRLCEGYGMPTPPVMAAMASAWYNRALRTALYQQMSVKRSDAPNGEVNQYPYNIETGQ